MKSENLDIEFPRCLHIAGLARNVMEFVEHDGHWFSSYKGGLAAGSAL